MTPPDLCLRLTDASRYRNRRLYTWPWRWFFLLLGLALGWLMRGLIG